MVWKPTNEVLNTLELETKIRHKEPFHNTPNITVTDTGSSPLLLDKLAQLRQGLKSGGYNPTDNGKIRILNRAKSKYITNGLALALVNLHSPLEKYYWGAYHCNDTILQQHKTLTTHYCNSRICHICNRIRTAKLINGYNPVLSKFEDPQFVTVTIPNVTDKELRKAITRMTRAFVTIKSKFYEDSRRREANIFKGIRKIECTYNESENTYHPHFHIVLNDTDIANRFVTEWLNIFPTATRSAQDIRRADERSIKELFKYVTKIVTKTNGVKGFNPISIRSVDVIMNALYRMRTFQPFGGVKKVSEDVDEIDSQEYDFLTEIPEGDGIVWTYENEIHDWIDILSGEVLSGFVPDEQLSKLVNTIESG